MAIPMPPELFDEKWQCVKTATGWARLTNTQWLLVEALWSRVGEKVHASELDAMLDGPRRRPVWLPRSYGAVKVHMYNIRKRLGEGGPIEIVSTQGDGYGLRLRADRAASDAAE